MNRKGFTLFELLGCLVLLGVILGIGLYSARGTISTSLSTLNEVSLNEIEGAARTYVLENGVTWVNDLEEYTCVKVLDLVEAGYFDKDEVISYKNNFVKIIRNSDTKVINNASVVSECD